MGDGKSHSFFIEYRPRKSSLDKGEAYAWQRSEALEFSSASDYSIQVNDPLFSGFAAETEDGGMVNASAAASGIEYRVVVVQDGLEIQGNLLILD